MDPVKRRTFLKIVGAGSLATMGNIGSSGKVTPIKPVAPVAPTTLKITPKGRAYREFLKTPLVAHSIENHAELRTKTFNANTFEEFSAEYDEAKRKFRNTVAKPAFKEAVDKTNIDIAERKKVINPSLPASSKPSVARKHPFMDRLASNPYRNISQGANIERNKHAADLIKDARSAYAKQIKLARDKISSAKKPVVAKPVKKRSLLHIFKKIFTKGRG